MSDELPNNLHKPWRAIVSHRQRARQFRNESSSAEALLWQNLRNRQLENLKFRRQHPIGRFILDFYCPEHKTAVELDGSVHYNQKAEDQDREAE
jgi:very-short-patch-repair endonuclease